MQPVPLVLLLLVLSSLAFYLGRRRSLLVANGGIRVLHSLPDYYGYYVALWCSIPPLLLLTAWLAFEPAIITKLVVAELPREMRESEQRLSLVVNDITNIVKGDEVGGQDVDPSIQAAAERYRHLQGLSGTSLALLALVFAIGSGTYALRNIRPELRARNRVEGVIRFFLIASSTIAIFTTIGIVLSVLVEAIRFFQKIPITDFIFGLKWSPQIAMRADQVGGSGAFGAVPLFTGTLLISGIALLVAVPIGLMSAIFLSEYASRHIRTIAKPVIEVLAGIPTVVYGFFAALVVAPLIRDSGVAFGVNISSESALTAGMVMGIMIIPFVSSLADDVINAVPQALRDGSYGIGATKSETIRQVVIPAALPGIVGGILLAASRAIGETMIVVMAAGLTANLTANPFEAVTTVTVQIVTLLVGDQEFDSPKTLAAFALGLVLFLATLGLNIIALHIVRKYREQYE